MKEIESWRVGPKAEIKLPFISDVKGFDNLEDFEIGLLFSDLVSFPETQKVTMNALEDVKLYELTIKLRGISQILFNPKKIVKALSILVKI